VADGQQARRRVATVIGVQHLPTRTGIRAVAAFEAFKGLVALAAASGLPLLLHRNLQDVAVRLVEHAHLNPAAHYPRVFIEAATHLENGNLAMIALGAVAYSVIRLVEASGLYKGAAWAEVVAVASGAIYVPFEVAGIIRHATWLGVGAFVLNVAVVAIMLRALSQKRTP